jgi:hypothetical protein
VRRAFAAGFDPASRDQDGRAKERRHERSSCSPGISCKATRRRSIRRRRYGPF